MEVLGKPWKINSGSQSVLTADTTAMLASHGRHR